MTRQHTVRRRVVRAATAGIAVLLAAAIAAGCDDGEPDRGSPAAKDEPVRIREVTPPEPDEDIAEDLGDAATILTEAGCTFGTYEEQPAEHVDEGDELEGDDFPPTTGTHYGNWAPFGGYDEPIEDGFVVHNLEHGGVVAWLGTEVGDEHAAAITDLLDDEEKWIGAPRRDIEGLFSAAWAKGLHCPPEALAQLESDAAADALDAWYETVVSTGSEAEKDVPAYAGAMKEPTPVRDISAESPF